jgi:hypothetical protein
VHVSILKASACHYLAATGSHMAMMSKNEHGEEFNTRAMVEWGSKRLLGSMDVGKGAQREAPGVASD